MNTPRKRVSAEPEAQADEPFHIKYRPKSLKEVVGQDAVVKSLTDAMKQATRPHSFLLTGPSGCGKTTLSRIIAADLGCSPSNILEVDAASNSGIDAMREVMSTIRYQGFGESPNRAIIIDEAHALSKSAWQSMLKPIEEPPPHVYFFVLTTETGKVPETIVTRCHNYQLKPVRFDPLMDLLEGVVEAEGLSTPTRIVELAARACSGSPRQALVMLSMIRDCKTEEEAADLLEAPLENKEVIDLCREMVGGKLSWDRVVKTLKAMPEMSAESIRIVMVNYLSACLLGARSEKDTLRLLDVLHEFRAPFNPTDKLAPLLLAIGNIIYK